jgi:hypothetical protein
MFKKIVPFLAILLLSSCATLTNTKKDKMFVYADKDSTFICINYDTSQIYQLPVKLVLPRSEKDITLIVINDTLQRKLYLPSIFSGKAVFGNIYPFWPLGFMFDTSSPKAYAYPKHTTVLFDDTDYPYIGSKKWINPEKNLVRIKVGFPAGNLQNRTIEGKQKNIFSYHAISFGAEYYFSKKYSLNFGISKFVNSTASKFKTEEGFRRPIYHSTFGTDIQIGTDIKRFHIAAGIQYCKLLVYYQDQKTYFDEFNNPNQLYEPRYRIKYFGPALSTYYRISHELNIAANYYGSLISSTNGSSKSEYGHILSFEISYTPDIFRPSKRKINSNTTKKI